MVLKWIRASAIWETNLMQSAMLYAKETWCLNDKNVAILRRTTSAMLEATCRVKLINRKSTSKLMTMLGLTVSIEMAPKAN